MAGRSAVGSVGAATLAAVALVSCGDESAGSDEPAPSAREPSSRISDDLVIPRGAILLGAPFARQIEETPTVAPTQIEPSIDVEPPMGTAPPNQIGQGLDEPAYAVELTAFLQVTGDPVKVFADLLHQARDLGIEMMTISFDDGPRPFCEVTNAPTPSPAESGHDVVPLGAEDLPGGPLAVSCNAGGLSKVTDGFQRGLVLDSFVSERTDPYVSFVRVISTEYDVGDSAGEQLDDYYRPAPPLEGSSPITPPAMPSPPQPGEPLSEHLEDEEILDGSELMVPAIPSPTCMGDGYGGSAVLLRVDGLDQMVSRYEDQFGDVEVYRDQSFEYDGSAYRYRSYSGGGGYGTLELWGTDAPERPGYLLIERCPG